MSYIGISTASAGQLPHVPSEDEVDQIPIKGTLSKCRRQVYGAVTVGLGLFSVGTVFGWASFGVNSVLQDGYVQKTDLMTSLLASLYFFTAIGEGPSMIFTCTGYLGIYALGIGSLCWIVSGEINHPDFAEIASAINSATYWLIAGLSTSNFFALDFADFFGLALVHERPDFFALDLADFLVLDPQLLHFLHSLQYWALYLALSTSPEFHRSAAFFATQIAAIFPVHLHKIEKERSWSTLLGLSFLDLSSGRLLATVFRTSHARSFSLSPNLLSVMNHYMGPWHKEQKDNLDKSERLGSIKYKEEKRNRVARMSGDSDFSTEFTFIYQSKSQEAVGVT